MSTTVMGVVTNGVVVPNSPLPEGACVEIHVNAARLEATAERSPLDNGIERLTRADFTPPSTIELEFADGLRVSLAIQLLGMPLDRIDWPTLKAAPGGEKVVVKGIKGDLVPIDAATVRYLVDKKYAASMDKSLKSLQFSRDDLAEMARDNPPPSEWYDEPEQDLTRESWK